MQQQPAKPVIEKPPASEKLNFWQRLLFMYRWMSLRNKVALWGVLAIAVMVAISFQWLHPAYRTAKMFYFIRLAEEYVAKKDYSSAPLAYRKALLCGPERPEAWKSLAKFLETVDSPEVISVEEKLAKMEPNVREHRYKQVAAAIKYGRGYQAQEVLDNMPEDWRNDPDYLRNIASLLIQKNQLVMAEEMLNRLLKQKPNDEQAAFDLALARSRSADPEINFEARQQLDKIGASGSKFSADAYRRLITIAVEAEDVVEADRLATKLIELPEATLNDRLTHAQFELVSKSISAPSTLANLRLYAQNQPEQFEGVVNWFLSNKVDAEGVAAWLENLPVDVASQAAVQAGLQQYYLNISDFPRVFKILRQREEILNLPPEVVDLAEKAINQVDDSPSNASRLWLDAIYKSDGNPQALYYLSLLSSAKGWTGATSQALSALADNAPGQAGVWNLLAKHESTAGNLPGYYKALCGLMKINPYDIHVASDWVIAAVLLRKEETNAILDVAKRTYDATEPADPWAGTAYSMSLLRDRRPQMALEVMNRMTESNRRLPQRAIYMGAVLAAAGHNAEALEYFSRSEEFGNNNFPEELALRRIWKGVAMGEATTDEEKERILSMRKDLTKESSIINADLKKQLSGRADPAEVSRILAQLKAQTSAQESTALPGEVQKMLQEARKEVQNPRPPAKP
jgi:tetratricopeptide (TPR) repeat protein